MLAVVLSTLAITVALLILPSKAVEAYKDNNQQPKTELNQTVEK